jgi:hypothetical protein
LIKPGRSIKTGRSIKNGRIDQNGPIEQHGPVGIVAIALANNTSPVGHRPDRAGSSRNRPYRAYSFFYRPLRPR